MSLLGKNHGMNKTQPDHTDNNILSLLSSQHLTMLKSPGRSKEISARWNEVNRRIFREKVGAGIIDIDNTTPSYIDSIRLKFWGGKNLSPSVTTTGNLPLLSEQIERPLALESVSFFHILCMHPPHKLTSDAARTAFAAASTTENDDEYDTDDADDATTDDKPAMSTKKKATTAAAATKSGVDEITSGLNKTKVSVSTPKAPVFTSYLTKVQDPILVRTVFVDGEQWVEFDMSIAAALLCGDGINAVLASDGMSISLQRGVYSSFFTNRRLRKDLGDKYNKDSSRVTAHRKVCDEFKKKETSARNGIVYGECQFVQLPFECTGLVEETFSGRVQTPIAISFTTTTKVDGMSVSETEDHTFNSW